MGLLEKLSLWLGKGRAEVTVLVLGLDNSGKSTTLNALRASEARALHVPPTVAPQRDHFTSGGVSFSAWDVSGAARHRALWERHYRRADAVIFVVDAADHLRLVVAREELELMLAHPDMCARRVPLLVLANKSDHKLALAPHQVAAGTPRSRRAPLRATVEPRVACCSVVPGARLRQAVAHLRRERAVRRRAAGRRGLAGAAAPRPPTLQAQPRLATPMTHSLQTARLHCSTDGGMRVLLYTSTQTLDSIAEPRRTWYDDRVVQLTAYSGGFSSREGEPAILYLLTC